jgi:hypothetical protein
MQAVRNASVIHCETNQLTLFSVCNCTYRGRDISVSTATGYGLDGPGLESRWRPEFSHTSRPALESTQPPVQWVHGSFSGIKRPRRGADHPPLLAPRSRESKAIPLSPLWAFGSVTGYLRLLLLYILPVHCIIFNDFIDSHFIIPLLSIITKSQTSL